MDNKTSHYIFAKLRHSSINNLWCWLGHIWWESFETPLRIFEIGRNSHEQETVPASVDRSCVCWNVQHMSHWHRQKRLHHRQLLSITGNKGVTTSGSRLENVTVPGQHLFRNFLQNILEANVSDMYNCVSSFQGSLNTMNSGSNVRWTNKPSGNFFSLPANQVPEELWRHGKRKSPGSRMRRIPNGNRIWGD